MLFELTEECAGVTRNKLCKQYIDMKIKTMIHKQDDRYVINFMHLPLKLI